MTRAWVTTAAMTLGLTAALVTGCGKKQPPVARPTPPAPPQAANAATRPPSPPEPVNEPVIVPPEPVREDRIQSASLDDLNRNSPLKPVFFELDSSDIAGPAQAILDEETALSDSEVKEYLVFGDFPRAFGYREVYPMKTEVAPPNNPAEFRQDIVLQVKASEFGVPYVYDPRYAVLSTAEAA